MLLRAAFFASLAIVGACSLVVSTADLAGDRDAQRDGSGDARSEAPPADASPSSPTDGGSLPGEDAASTSPCASPHVFCDDFDQGGVDLGSRWDAIETRSGTLALSSERAASPPRALRAVLHPASGRRDTKLTKTVAVDGNTVRVELDLFFDHTAGAYTEVDPLQVLVQPAPAGHRSSSLFVFVRSNGARFQYWTDRADGGQISLENEIPLGGGAWHHLTLTLTRDPARATLLVDGVSSRIDTVAAPATTAVSVSIGGAYVEDLSNTWTIDVDNVVVDAF